jgi:hypothetical protein
MQRGRVDPARQPVEAFPGHPGALVEGEVRGLGEKAETYDPELAPVRATDTNGVADSPAEGSRGGGPYQDLVSGGWLPPAQHGEGLVALDGVHGVDGDTGAVEVEVGEPHHGDLGHLLVALHRRKDIGYAPLGVDAHVPELAREVGPAQCIVDAAREAEGTDDPNDRGDGAGHCGTHRQGPVAFAALECQPGADDRGKRSDAPQDGNEREPPFGVGATPRT